MARVYRDGIRTAPYAGALTTAAPVRATAQRSRGVAAVVFAVLAVLPGVIVLLGVVLVASVVFVFSPVSFS